MAMMNNPLLDFKRNRQFQGLVDVLAECLPDNANLQEKLSDLTSSKGSYIKQLVAKWDQRMQPDYTELDIRQLNIQYLARQDLAQVNFEVRDENISTISSKDWILKERDIWRGYNPESGNYFQKPIVFGGKLDWDVNFLPLVISDSASNSINLIQTLLGFIRKGSSMGLGVSDWSQTFLILAKKFLPLVFSSLSRHSENLELLFTDLASTINSDHEIAKLRGGLNNVSRKCTEQVHVALYRIKAIYSMILAINNPQFTDAQCQTKSDHYAVNCIPYLVSDPCNKALQLFANAKTQEGEATSVGESCNFISSKENMGLNIN